MARYTTELLPGLVATHQIDLFVEGAPDTVHPPDPRIAIRSAHDFVWTHARHPYDLVIYQMGNAPCHDYMWAYLARYPGLVVLHDGQLHHARGLFLRRSHRDDDYRNEFAYNHPGVDVDAAELGLAGWLGSLTYLWPMRRAVVDGARMVVVHSDWLAGEIRDEQPSTPVRSVDMGVPLPPVRHEARAAVRARHDIPADAVLLVAFGAVTPEKRIPQVIRAMGSMAGDVHAPYLLLVGEPAGHYDPLADAQARGVADRVRRAGFVAHEDLGDYLAAADVCVCLRWPSSRETSAAWLRCLAAGRPTLITDLVHTVDVPALDPRSWKVIHAAAGVERPLGEPVRVEPAAVSIDILDEDHSLGLALRRLSTDAPLRARLAAAAADLWRRRFTLDGMIARYEAIIAEAVTMPIPDETRRAKLPQHLVSDGAEKAARLLRAMGVPDARLETLWTPGPTWPA